MQLTQCRDRAACVGAAQCHPVKQMTWGVMDAQAKRSPFQPPSEGQDAEFLSSLGTVLDPLAVRAGEEPRAAFAGKDLRSCESAPSFYR